LNEGSIAAPTAGLHFTEPLLNAIALKGVKIRELTLHVGVGTFRPVRTEIVEDHVMDMEHFEIPGSLKVEMEEAKASGRRIVAVGTTTTRSLEGYFSGIYRNGSKIPPSPVPRTRARGKGIFSGKCDLEPIRGTTDIFIYPGYTFRAINSLITNFHLPHSTPLMLVCALAGRENIFTAYHEAIMNGYRFLSYGDAMLIV
jgi:S-adenosylmethionine:tRNA ribosyltransferase-isomerase